MDRAVGSGGGRYEVIGWVAEPTAFLLHRPPAPTYLGMIARGLHESHGWPAERIIDYLTRRPGVAGGWPPDAVTTLVAEALVGIG
ncbi:hypothetical protein ACLQ24_18260 [Micromonospora sp. DT4]|uniref:hypothetical protein n=1 Tax=Micromonospora sp. DT4 TaxID=3393438 RepID=UPI003CF80946